MSGGRARGAFRAAEACPSEAAPAVGRVAGDPVGAAVVVEAAMAVEAVMAVVEAVVEAAAVRD